MPYLFILWYNIHNLCLNFIKKLMDKDGNEGLLELVLNLKRH